MESVELNRVHLQTVNRKSGANGNETELIDTSISGECHQSQLYLCTIAAMEVAHLEMVELYVFHSEWINL